MSNLGNNENVAAATTPRQVQLTVSGVQNDLKNGLSRPMIQAKYNLSGKDLKDLFAHPALKGLKTKTAPGFILIDDTVAPAPAEATNVEAQPISVKEVEEVEVYETEEVNDEVQQPAPVLEPWEQDMTESDSVL